MPFIPKFVLIAAATAFLSSGAVAKPSVRIKTVYYTVNGSTAPQLKAQMQAKGTKGWWGYTRWWVKWTAGCRVSVTITYTYPRWSNRKSAPKALRIKWDRMIANLRTHEIGHGRHGLNAAAEVERHRCGPRSMAIIRKWAQEDKNYDRRTQSGRTQGVVLP